MEITYEYKFLGGFADTIGVLADGRRMAINTQYESVLPLGDCVLDDINCEDVIKDARANGLFGQKPKDNKPKPTPPPLKKSGVCQKCHTYCYGDCDAN